MAERSARLSAERGALGRFTGDAGRQARLVAAGGVPVNNALARHLVDERDGLLQPAFGARQVVAVDGGADGLEGVAQARPELPVALAILETLPMRFERGFVRCHVIFNLRKPLILTQWPFQSSISAAPTRRRPARSPRLPTCRSRSAPAKSSG